MKLLKNRFLAIVLCVALFLSVFYSVLGLTGRVSVFHQALGVVATPFRLCFDGIGRALSGFGDYFGEVDRLRSENEQLREQLAGLSLENADKQVLAGENAWLRELLKVSRVLSHCKTLDATVVGHAANSYLTMYTLNRGSLHGVKTGMAVVTDTGIVGRVSEVSLNTCRVTTIIEDGISVGAICAASGARGVVTGTLGLRGQGLCTMENISEFSDLEAGDVIISSGGGIYPYGFPVGVVVDKTHHASTRTVTATIKPAVDFSSLSRVLIVTEVDVSVMNDMAEEQFETESETQAE